MAATLGFGDPDAMVIPLAQNFETYVTVESSAGSVFDVHGVLSDSAVCKTFYGVEVS